MKLRSLFISDVHLGTRHAKTAYLLEFLKKVKRDSTLEKLYIVGDFVDGWKLRRSWYWNDECNLILRKVLSLVKDGTHTFLTDRWITDTHFAAPAETRRGEDAIVDA